jgi:FMN phosphatase YigB (HAD superfamily)
MPYNELLAEVYKALAERISLASVIDSANAESALAADVASPNDDFVEEGNAFARSLAEWPPFPDTVEALNGLKRLGYKLVILSNVDDASIKGMTLPRLDPESYLMPTRLSTGGAPPGKKSTKKTGSDPLFTLVLTAQQLGAYKPDPRVLSSALEIIHSRLGVAKEDVLMVAQSLFHDHVPAKSLGLGSVWIDREGSEMGLDVAEGERNEDGKGRIWDWRFRTLREMVASVEEEKSRS